MIAVEPLRTYLANRTAILSTSHPHLLGPDQARFKPSLTSFSPKNPTSPTIGASSHLGARPARPAVLQAANAEQAGPTCHDQRSRPRLEADPALAGQQSSRDGTPDQHAQPTEGEGHPEPSPNQVGSRGRDFDGDGSDERQQRGGEEAIDDGEDDQSGGGVDGHPGKGQQARHEDGGEVEIQGSESVGQEIGAQASECGAGVGQDDGVGGQLLGHVALLRGVQLDVEEEDVETHEPEADAETEA